MQSSADSSSISCRRDGTSGDELEDGEIGDDEDDELWEQLETTFDSSNNCPMAASASSSSSSPFVRNSSSLQSDRLCGGFWAKLKTVTSHTSSIIMANGASPAASNYVPLDEANRLGASFGLRDTDEDANSAKSGEKVDSIEVECNPSKKRRVSQPRNRDLQVSLVSGTNGGDTADEEELLELQLRLEALRSTMKRADKVADTPSKRSSPRIRRQSNEQLNPKRRSNDSCPKAYRKNQPSDRDGREERRYQRQTRSERSSVGAKTNKNKSNDARHLQHERERILSIPDPKDQYHAFLDLVTTPRNDPLSIRQERPGSGGKTPHDEDNYEATNMEISSDSDDESRTPSSSFAIRPAPSKTNVPMLTGFWSRPPASAAPVLRELENTAKNEDQNPVVVDEGDDEEMEALRELALKSMMRSKEKKSQPVPAQELAAVLIPEPLVENHPPTDHPERQTDDEETEVVITLDKAFLKRQVELARQKMEKETGSSTKRKREDSPAMTSPKDAKTIGVSESGTASPSIDRKFGSPEKEVVGGLFNKDPSSIPSTSYGEPFPMRDTALRSTRSMAARTKMPQIVKVIHKPLLIPLDSSSSDDDDDGDETSMSKNQTRVPDASATSGIKSASRLLLEDFFRRESLDKRTQKGKNGHAAPSNSTLVQQLEARLRMCVEDLAKHQNSLTEDKKRLRTLESIVSRQKTDLRMAEMRMQKLKQELRLIESQSASYRVTIAKFNGEIQKVQSRVDKNFELQRVYLRQWKEIEQLVAKYKIDLVPKVPDIPSSTIPKRVTPRKLSTTNKRPSRNGEKAPTGPKKTAKATKIKIDSMPESERDIEPSPLRWFKSYRLSPGFRTLDQYQHCSNTFSNKLDPFVPLCPFEVSGRCLDPECLWQHERDYLFSELEMIADLLSYRPDVVAAGADEKMTMTFATDLYKSLHAKLPLNDILLYCLSQMDSHSREQGGARLGIETDRRRWVIEQDPNRYKSESINLKIARVGEGLKDERGADATGRRYFLDPGSDVNEEPDDAQCTEDAQLELVALPE